MKGACHHLRVYRDWHSVNTPNCKFDMCLTVHHRYNKVEDQLDTTIKIYWSSKQLNMFRAILCPSSGALDYVFRVKDVVRATPFTPHTVRIAALQVSDRQQSEDIISHAVNRSPALLMMGKELPETCWALVNVNKFLLLHLVGPLLYYYSQLCFGKQLIFFSYAVGSLPCCPLVVIFRLTGPSRVICRYQMKDGI